MTYLSLGQQYEFYVQGLDAELEISGVDSDANFKRIISSLGVEEIKLWMLPVHNQITEKTFSIDDIYNKNKILFYDLLFIDCRKRIDVPGSWCGDGGGMAVNPHVVLSLYPRKQLISFVLDKGLNFSSMMGNRDLIEWLSSLIEENLLDDRINLKMAKKRFDRFYLLLQESITKAEKQYNYSEIRRLKPVLAWVDKNQHRFLDQKIQMSLNDVWLDFIQETDGLDAGLTVPWLERFYQTEPDISKKIAQKYVDEIHAPRYIKEEIIQWVNGK